MDTLSQRRVVYRGMTEMTGPRFRFLDLFAGIGGFRLGAEAHGGVCVQTIERDPFACRIHCANFAPPVVPTDLLEMKVGGIADHDCLLAGFPCQPYIGAGKRQGMDDPRGGEVWEALVRVIAAKRPPLFVLENVPRLISHRAAWKRMTDDLSGQGYNLTWRVVNARAWVPQRRKRLFVAGSLWSRKPVPILDLLDTEEAATSLVDILEEDTDPKLYLTEKAWAGLLAHRDRQRDLGRGFGVQAVYPSDKSHTISARYHKDGSECLVWDDAERSTPRRLSVREVARVMGFPDSFRLDAVSKTRAYTALGNAVVPAVAQAVLGRCMPYLDTCLRGGNAR